MQRALILRPQSTDGDDRSAYLKAMVEFATKDDAEYVKDHLQGADIYDGCCTMSIQFAIERVFKLRVPRNCEDSWDFTAEGGERSSASSFSSATKRSSSSTSWGEQQR